MRAAVLYSSQALISSTSALLGTLWAPELGLQVPALLGLPAAFAILPTSQRGALGIQLGQKPGEKRKARGKKNNLMHSCSVEYENKLNS